MHNVCINPIVPMSPFPKPFDVRASYQKGLYPARPPSSDDGSDDERPETLEIPTKRNLFRAMSDGWNVTCTEQEKENVECKTISRLSKDDMFWFLEKVYEDTKEIELDELKANPDIWDYWKDVEIVSEDPLTLRNYDLEEEGDYVLGTRESDYPYVVYTATLLVYKIKGRTLPKPDPEEDYTF